MTDHKKGGSGFRWPVLQGRLPINRAQIPAELIAGLTLAALAIPEVMGYTKIAGTPVVTGLYTILIPMALFALLGSSRHLVVGADSAVAAILAGGLAGMATTGSAEYVALTSMLALMAAVFLIVARIIRLGFLADFLSRTVLVGFLTGVGIQVALSQLPDLLGLPEGGHGTIGKLMHAAGSLGQISLPTLVVAAVVLAIIVGSKRISKKIPGPLIAVIGAITVSWALDLKSLGVGVLGAVPSGLPDLGLPQVDWSLALIMKLAPTAFSIFIVVLAQSAATSRAYAARYNERFSENVDLVGLGVANLGAALSGTFPVNGSPTKTQMVDSAGGHSQLAQVTTVVIVLLVLLFLTGPLAFMPGAVLAAVVFLIGLDLIDVAGMRRILQERPWEFWLAVLVMLVVVLVGVKQGIVLAIVASLIIHTRHGYRPTNLVVAKSDSGHWQALPIEQPRQLVPGLLVYRFSHGMYYANAELLSEQVQQLVSGAQPPLKWFCMDLAAVDEIDYSAADTLRSLHGTLKEQGVRLVFTMIVEDKVRAELQHSGIIDLVGKDAIYGMPDEVVAAYQQQTDNDGAQDSAPTTEGNPQ